MKKQFAILITLALLVPVAADNNDSKPAKRTASPAVVLTIDYGDGAQKRFPAVPWQSDMTVLDALVWAKNHPHGIKFNHRGKGALAMVGQIDDVKNSGSGKNWIFYVNEKLSEKSCGASKLASADKILWRFEVYR